MFGRVSCIRPKVYCVYWSVEDFVILGVLNSVKFLREISFHIASLVF